LTLANRMSTTLLIWTGIDWGLLLLMGAYLSAG
jgi:hypothetical protein